MADETTATVEQAPAGQDGLDAAISAFEAQFASDAQAPSETGQQASTEQPTPEGTVQEPSASDDIDEDLETSNLEQGGPAKPGRAKRLAEQLTQAEAKARDAQAALDQRRQFEQDALRQFVDLVLPDAEFDQLRVLAERGEWDTRRNQSAADTVNLARQWRQMVTPIADSAHRAVAQQFNAALESLRTLDGMDGESHQKVVAAQSPGEKLRLMWQLGKKIADDGHKDRIAELEQEVQALKTNRTANGSQPASGGSPKNGMPLGLAGMIDPKTGLLTDEAERLSWDEVQRRFGVAS